MGPWCSKVEGVVIDLGFWKGRRIFLTGHTGFKGAWMALLLRSLGAEIFGFALPPENRKDGLFTVARIEHDLAHCEGDLRDLDAVEAAVSEGQPEIIIHMAAQALVRRSYADPVTTYASNVLGTVHLLESVRRTPCVKAVIIVTSDKCYDDRNSIWGYREIDPLGGHDPYSSSKGCAELVVELPAKLLRRGLLTEHCLCPGWQCDWGWRLGRRPDCSRRYARLFAGGAA